MSNIPPQFNMETKKEYINRLIGLIMHTKTKAMNQDLLEDDIVELIEMYDYVLEHDEDETHKTYVKDNFQDFVSLGRVTTHEPFKRVVKGWING